VQLPLNFQLIGIVYGCIKRKAKRRGVNMVTWCRDEPVVNPIRLDRGFLCLVLAGWDEKEKKWMRILKPLSARAAFGMRTDDSGRTVHLRARHRLWAALAVIVALLVVWLPRASEPASAAGIWSFTSQPMPDARQQAMAVLLTNGKILVAGGFNATGVLNSAALFDSSNGSWTPAASMSHPRAAGTATVLTVGSDAGDVLVVGGYDGQLDRNDAELYNPSTNMWTEISSSMKSGRSHHTATVLGDGTGRVLIAGGLASNTQLAQPDELYVPSTRNFTSTGKQITSRYDHTATLLSTGQVLLAGGYTSTGANPTPTALAELYDPTVGKFDTTGSMRTPRAGHTASLLNDNARSVLVAGGVQDTGKTPTAAAELYNPSTGTWSPTGSMSGARAYHTASLLNDNSVLVAGGVQDASNAPTATAELYSPSSGTWSSTGSMNVARAYHTGTLLSNGSFMVAGGQNLSSSEIYIPANCTTCGGGATATPVPSPSPTATPTPLTVSSTAPGSGSLAVLTTNSVTITFSRILNASTVTTYPASSSPSVFLTQQGSATPVPATVSVSGTSVTLAPVGGLALATTYTLTVKSGSSGVQDTVGTTLTSDYTSTFTTSLMDCGQPAGTTALVSSAGDGIPDYCKINGAHVQTCSTCLKQFINLPAMGANPNHKDIFVQEDWMQGTDPSGASHNQQLSSTAIQKVVTAFNNASQVTNLDGTTGIHLHVDAGPNSACAPGGYWTCTINGTATTTWSSLSAAGSIAFQFGLGSLLADGNYDWGPFQQIKDSTAPSGQTLSFTKSGRQPFFHFMIAGYNYGGTASSGNSRGIPTSDFLVTLGSFFNGVGTVNQQAGTFMHELGHNLGLHHGGAPNDDNNFKSNYLSIMNYMFQMSGLTKNGVSGNFDYSELGGPLPTLNESALSESLGLGSAATGYGTSHYCSSSKSYVSVSNAAGPIDWNCNGTIDPGTVAYDIDGDNPSQTTPSSTLAPYDDWPNLVYNGGLIGHGNQVTLPPEAPPDMHTPDVFQQIAMPVPVDVDPGQCPNPISASHSPATFDVSIVSAPASGDTPAFDATQVDPSTVKVESVSPLTSPAPRIDDEAAPYSPYIGKPLQANACTTVKDGIPDLTFTFSAGSVLQALGTVTVGDVRILHLTGNLKGSNGNPGQAIQGEDVVVISK